MFKFVFKTIFVILLIAGGFYHYFYYYNLQDRCSISLDPSFNSKVKMGDAKKAITVLRQAYPESYKAVCQNVKKISTEKLCESDEIKACETRTLATLRAEKIVNIGTDKTDNFGYTVITLAEEACFMGGLQDLNNTLEAQCSDLAGKIKRDIFKY